MLAVCTELQARPGDAFDSSGGGSSLNFVRHAQHEIEQGHFTAAIALCDRAIALYPAFIRAHFDRGRALLASGRNDEAIA
jgi:tetratricopeptide (TPR) repeat protein